MFLHGTILPKNRYNHHMGLFLLYRIVHLYVDYITQELEICTDLIVKLNLKLVLI